MKVTGIIAEYNPFHNGHLYQLKTAKEAWDTDFIIIVLSGDFMQRGIPGILNKWERAKMALGCGADLVLELPVLSACASAEPFAAGGVTLLEKTGVVTDLCFGAESDDLPAFYKLADFLNREPAAYQDALRAQLRLGKSFPAAQNAALSLCCGENPADDALLSSPNNILGLSYVQRLLSLGSGITPRPLKRRGSGYHDTALSGPLASATAIRYFLCKPDGDALSGIQDQVPPAVFSILEAAQKDGDFLFSDDLSAMLHYKLLCECASGFTSYLDVTPDLSNKIRKNLSDFTCWSDFVLQLKSKELTHTRISRALLHILLNLTEEDFALAGIFSFAPYLRLLGFRKSAAPLLSAIKKNADIPLIAKLADAKSYLSDDACALLSKDIFAADVYRLALTAKTGKRLPNEFSHSPIVF